MISLQSDIFSFSSQIQLLANLLLEAKASNSINGGIKESIWKNVLVNLHFSHQPYLFN